MYPTECDAKKEMAMFNGGLPWRQKEVVPGFEPGLPEALLAQD